jgi:hypothetical protein
LFYPDRSLFNGAAEVASQGFLDTDNVPAWDTWLDYGADGSGSKEESNQNILVSWVPAEFNHLVAAGIDVNPEGSIEWTRTQTGLLPAG